MMKRGSCKRKKEVRQKNSKGFRKNRGSKERRGTAREDKNKGKEGKCGMEGTYCLLLFFPAVSGQQDSLSDPSEYQQLDNSWSLVNLDLS